MTNFFRYIITAFFGVRYDFLCANYTAFDQTLFNCNFVSNVDCENSKKFWHRNDELYKTKSTTTLAPVVYNFYTQPPQAYALASPRVRGRLTAQPQLQQIQLIPQVATQIQETPLTEGQIIAPPQVPTIISEVPGDVRRRPRPPARRRPLYDYYDDDYEESPRRVRPRRPRPLYYDYEDYEDERYDRRGGNRRRRPYDRMRPMRRDKERRRKYEYYDEEDDEYEDPALEKKTVNTRRPKYEDDYEDDTRRGRPSSRRAEPSNERPSKKTRRPFQDTSEYESKRRKSSEENIKPSRLGVRRPPSEDYEDDLQEADNDKNGRNDKNSNEDPQTLIKPVSGTLYDRPRPAPKINRPVPKHAVNKFAYKSVSTTAQGDEYISDEYEDKLPNESQQRSSTNIDEIKDDEYSENPSRIYKRRKMDSNSSDVSRLIFKRPIKDGIKSSSMEANTSTLTTTTESLTTTDLTADKFRSIVRKFKRPTVGYRSFSGRNLKSSNSTSSEEGNTTKSDTESENVESSLLKSDDTKITNDKAAINKSPLSLDTSSLLQKPVETTQSKSGPMRVKVPIRVNNYVKSTEATKLETLYDNYDVTLNEASPIVDSVGQKYPTGFDSESVLGRYYRASKL